MIRSTSKQFLTDRCASRCIARFSEASLGRGPENAATLIARIAFTLTLALTLAISAPASAKSKAKKPVAAAPAVTLDAPSERIALSVMESYASGVSKDRMRSAAKTLVTASMENGLDPYVVLGLIRIESSGWNHARSEKDARGLMQLMPFVAKAMAKEIGMPWKGADSLHDPDVNIRLGVHYLSTLVEKYEGDVGKALSAYSMGPSKLDGIVRRGKTPVSDYPVTVRWFAERYRSLAKEHGDVEPGLSRFEVALRGLEKDIGGKPGAAYAMATGKKDWNKAAKKKVVTANKAVAKTTPKVDVNRATYAELLLAHPSVTPAAAKLILDDRKTNGPFPTVDALARVPGLDARIAAALREAVVAAVEEKRSTLLASNP